MRVVQLLLSIGCLASLVFSAGAQGTAFSYQGFLKHHDVSANGSYDFRFSLWDAASGGNQLGTTLTLTNVTVRDGLFTVTLDFGNVWDGNPRFLQIAVRPANTGEYTTLSPRVPIMSAPYASFAFRVPWTGVLGIPSASGDVSGTYPNLTVTGLQGHAVSSASPSVGQVLKWDGSSWAPATDEAGGGFWSASGSHIFNTNSGNVGIGTTTPAAKLDVNGTARVKVLEITGADIAEKFPTTETLEPGTVVEIDPDHPGHLRKARGAYNKRVAGVVAGANGLSQGIILGNLEGSENHTPIAINGRVWVYADATHEAIEPGDFLTTSETPGYAMKANDLPRAQGAILGKAMTRLEKGKTGMVLVLVNLQ
jgi:hypothetical protein